MNISITFNDLTSGQAMLLTSAAKDIDSSSAVLVIPGAGTVKDHLEPVKTPGPRMPRIDEDAVNGAAAATKPKATTKAATTKGGRATEPPADEEEADATPTPAATKPRAVNGANGAAKNGAPAVKAKRVTPQLEEDDEEEEAPAETDAEPEEEEQEAGDEDIDPRLIEAKKLTDIITVLAEQGITTKSKLIAEVTRLKPYVALIQKISDIPGRVTRAFEVYEAARG